MCRGRISTLRTTVTGGSAVVAAGYDAIVGTSRGATGVFRTRKVSMTFGAKNSTLSVPAQARAQVREDAGTPSRSERNGCGASRSPIRP